LPRSASNFGISEVDNQLLSDRFNGLVRAPEVLSQPVVGEIRRPLQLGGDEATHLALAEAASDEGDDEGVVTLLIVSETAELPQRLVLDGKFVAGTNPLGPDDDVSVFVLDDGQDHIPAADVFLEGAVFPGAKFGRMFVIVASTLLMARIGPSFDRNRMLLPDHQS
jgi:hypothetical protein